MALLKLISNAFTSHLLLPSSKLCLQVLFLNLKALVQDTVRYFKTYKSPGPAAGTAVQVTASACNPGALTLLLEP